MIEGNGKPEEKITVVVKIEPSLIREVDPDLLKTMIGDMIYAEALKVMEADED